MSGSLRGCFGEWDTNLAPRAFLCFSRIRVIEQNAAHHGCRSAITWTRLSQSRLCCAASRT
jgi:hypothetical protein